MRPRSQIRRRAGIIAGLLAIGLSSATAADDATPSVWHGLDDSERGAVLDFAEHYKAFMAKAVTEATFVSRAIEIARAAGFSELEPDSPMQPGARYYDSNRGRTLSLIVVGDQPMTRGFRMVGAHVDSPRLELKGRPLYDTQGFALFQTYRHGGIKNYQWVNIPLALVGHVDRKDGTRIGISVCLDAGDPVLIIPDLSPHVDHDYRDRSNREVIKGEELDPVIASLPDAQGSLTDAVLAHLESAYAISAEDLVSAELALVPAMPPRDVGFDRSLMAIYGQDDRLAAYAAMRALLAVETPPQTSVAFLVDNEEIGNKNNTGSESDYLVDLMRELLAAQRGDAYREIDARRALRNTRVVSTDVNPGVHPTYPGVWELGNAPRLGHGVNLKLYGGGFNANSEFIAWNRAYLDAAGIPWQTATYKGRASGGTIGNSLSRRNMEVIDYGVPLLSIHSTYAVSSKVDVYMLFRAMHAFYLYDG